jgi:hypothetical protein
VGIEIIVVTDVVEVCPEGSTSKFMTEGVAILLEAPS